MGDVETLSNVFDAAELMPDSDEVEVEIVNPRSKKGTGMYITVSSRDSDTYRGVQRRQGDNRLKNLGRRSGSSNITSEEIEEEALQLLVACTRKWRQDLKDKDGNVVRTLPDSLMFRNQELKFSSTSVRLLYDSVPTIKEQVDDGIHDRGNFKKR